MGFKTTNWSVIVKAQQSGEIGNEALSEIYVLYQEPLLAFIRSKGISPNETEDVLQDFFTELIAGHFLDSVDSSKGRFRTFLLTCLKRYMANRYHKENTQKRGGKFKRIFEDATQKKAAIDLFASTDPAPDQVFDREWALMIINRAVDRLYENESQGNKAELLNLFGADLFRNRTSEEYREIAQKLKSSEGAVKVSVHRLRKKLGDYIRIELKPTLSNPEDMDTEISMLMSVLDYHK